VLAQAIIALGHNLRLSVVAEGVEKAEQAAFLEEHGCDEAQGIYFSRPDEFEALLVSPLARAAAAG
jgi:EAL domain-containing protein (putative c-di-GMP-specific phosphodiesterase class I)